MKKVPGAADVLERRRRKVDARRRRFAATLACEGCRSPHCTQKQKHCKNAIDTPHACSPHCRQHHSIEVSAGRLRDLNIVGSERRTVGSFKLKLVIYFLLLSLLPIAAAFWGFTQVAGQSETRRVDARLQTGMRAMLASYQERRRRGPAPGDGDREDYRPSRGTLEKRDLRASPMVSSCRCERGLDQRRRRQRHLGRPSRLCGDAAGHGGVAPSGSSATSPSPCRSTDRSSTRFASAVGSRLRTALVILQHNTIVASSPAVFGHGDRAGRPDENGLGRQGPLSNACRSSRCGRPGCPVRRPQSSGADRRRQLELAQPAPARPDRVARCSSRSSRTSRAARSSGRSAALPKRRTGSRAAGSRSGSRFAAATSSRCSGTRSTTWRTSSRRDWPSSKPSGAGCVTRSPGLARRSRRRTTSTSCCASSSRPPSRRQVQTARDSSQTTARSSRAGEPDAEGERLEFGLTAGRTAFGTLTINGDALRR